MPVDASQQWVVAFEEGDGHDKKLLGGKGANLCEMTQIGIRVPPGFVITTAACLAFLEHPEHALPAGLMDQVRAQISALEAKTGKQFGGVDNPLTVSVRSGAAMSMPGMMDTILNLGLNTATVEGVIKQTGDARFGYDAYRRFIQLFGSVALGIADKQFDTVFQAVKDEARVTEDVGLGAKELKDVCHRCLNVVAQETGQPFPEDPYEQLEIAVKAVFNSWMGRRAVDYRRQFHITPEQANGTAVNVVAMVFGNRGPDSGTGVGFTRYPDTGENRMFGEYLVNAQGEDVVAGIRTPKPIEQLATEMPAIYEQLVTLRNRLESHYREVQDFEFTIERGTLYCLQTRNGKMNATARVRTAVEMTQEGLLTRAEALQRVEPEVLNNILYPQIDPANATQPLAAGLPASPGAAGGEAVFDADRAETLGNQKRAVILVREETKPDDIHGFFAAQGILTARGGKTSHAAVVARGMGKPCVAGAEGIAVDDTARQAVVGGTTINEGDWITIDGSTGHVYLGKINMIEAAFSKELDTLLRWADDVAQLRVLANADTPEDAQRARGYGAAGIGLCRTERMFNASDRLPIVVEMILAEDVQQRQAALDKLLPIQRSDFKALFEAMAPNPVTIRLLDPPIHEFLPSERQLQSDIAYLQKLREMAEGMSILDTTLSFMTEPGTPAAPAGVSLDPRQIDAALLKKQRMLQKVRALSEVNPMLGHRGVRLGITHPEIYTMQIRAVLEAAAECQRQGLAVKPEIMVPQVCAKTELDRVKDLFANVRQQVESTYHVSLEDVAFGTMLEVVRACLQTEALAATAEFFSFGTNDLSQAAFSFSREDAENKFLPGYIERGILAENPFEHIDLDGVGKLMEMAANWGRQTRPGMKIGICGEQGGDPRSIEFCHATGLSYVSCSAPRVPVARLAAGRAALASAAKG
mgnify:CR=1 FL=1